MIVRCMTLRISEALLKHTQVGPDHVAFDWAHDDWWQSRPALHTSANACTCTYGLTQVANARQLPHFGPNVNGCTTPEYDSYGQQH